MEKNWKLHALLMEMKMVLLKTVGQFLQMFHTVITWPRNSSPGYIAKKLKTNVHINLYINVHCSINNSPKWKQSKWPSADDDWVNRLWYIHTMDYYSAVKKDEVVIHATTWGTLKAWGYTKEAGHKRPHPVWFSFYGKWLPRTGCQVGKRKGVTAKGYGFCWEVMKMF